MKASYDSIRKVARIKGILLFASMCVIISYMRLYIETDLIFPQTQKKHNKICIIFSSGKKLININGSILRRINSGNGFYGTRDSYTIELFCVVNKILINRTGIYSLYKFTFNNLPRPPNLTAEKNEMREIEGGKYISYQKKSISNTEKMNPIDINEIVQSEINGIINYNLLMNSFFS